MANYTTKSPKPRSKTTKNGENNFISSSSDNAQSKSRVKFNKKPIKISSLDGGKRKSEEKGKKFERNPVKISPLEGGKSKFEEKGKKFERNPVKISTLEGGKRKFEGNGKNFERNPVKISPLEGGKRKFEGNGKKIELKTVKSSNLESGKSKFEEKGKKVGGNAIKSSYLESGKKFNKKKKEEGEYDDVSGMLRKPKRSKKTSIRIDPYDLSNKRLDDGIVLDDITNQQKKKDEEQKGKPEKVELSQNAQFRAIQPSPSILTFVRDNLLGRRRDIELRRAGYNTELSAPLDNIPFSESSERARIEENIFRNKLEFFAAAKVSSSFPPPGLPEIAFAGRSNVGKSSLLNALTRQWGVVRTSDKPGLTRTINFFNLGTKLNLVDLPGYGFAYAKDEVKEAWEDLVKEYVSTREGLKRVCLLIDTKWGMKPRDIELIHLMERSQTKYQIVLTKTDVVFPLDVARRAMQIEETLKKHKSIVQPVMMVSSKSGAGIRCLRTALTQIARFAKL